MRIVAGLSVLSALLAACGGGDDSSPTATPGVFVTASAPAGFGTKPPGTVVRTMTPVPTTEVTGPFPAAEAFDPAQLRMGDRSWEIDVASGDVYVVKPPRWPTSSDNHPRPGADSAAGTWRAEAQGADLRVTRADGSGYRVTSASLEGWSGSGAMLYLRRAETCGRSDVYVVDAESGTLRNLTAAARPLELSWSPNGAFIALHMLGVSREYEVALIDTATGVLRSLVAGPASGGGELIPVAWSADSARIGVYYNQGRDFCDLADPPTPPPPTELQVLSN